MMKAKFLLFFSIWLWNLSISSDVVAQSVKDYLNQGWDEYSTGNYEEAVLALNRGIQLDSTNTAILFLKGRVLVKQNQLDEAMENLLTAVISDTSDLIRYSYIQRDSSIMELWNHPKWQNLLNTVELRVCGENIELFRELISIQKADQNCRNQAIHTGKKYGWDSEEVRELNKRIEEVDSSNLVRIQEIISDYGYPGKKLVGQASGVAFLVLQHSDLDTQKKYFDLLRQAANKGDIEFSRLALMEDRILIQDGKKQKYGTQVCRDSITGIAEFCPMDDIEMVKERRKKVGLPSLESYARRSGVSIE